MSIAAQVHELKVSEYFFRLTSESIRVFSNGNRRHCTLDTVVNERVNRIAELATSYDADDLHAHLRIIPLDGDIELSVTILETSARSIDAAIPEIEKALGSSVRFAEAISLILFDLIVERKATEVLTKLGLNVPEAKDYRRALKQRSSNVIPFK